MKTFNRFFIMSAFLGIMFTSASYTQDVTWQKTLGGTDYERVESIQQTTDGGYIFVGYTDSNNGDVSGNHPDTYSGGNSWDVWVVKLDSLGNIQWQKSLGGSGYDEGASIIQTADGGYIFAGTTTSDDGDVSGYHGGEDVWIVKLSTTGDLVWQKCYGGSSEDGVYSIRQTTDGGYIFAGLTTSDDGDLLGQGFHGLEDMWVVKLDSLGNIQWQKSLGGSTGYGPLGSMARSVQQTIDGGYIVAGTTYANDGDVSGNHGGGDVWIVRLSATGAVVWSKCYGGTAQDVATWIRQTSDGGYIITGGTHSNDGDVTGGIYHGACDVWVIKLDSSADIVWNKVIGGSNDDNSYSVEQTTDGGYIVMADTSSIDGDITGLNDHGGGDALVIKLSATGDVVWKKCYGGSLEDYGYSMVQTSDSGYVFGGVSASVDGDLQGQGNHGVEDAWIVKLADVTSSIEPLTVASYRKILVYPNPTHGFVTIKGLDNMVDITIKITNYVGQLIYENSLEFNNPSLDFSGYRNGLYTIIVSGKDKKTGKKIISKPEKIIKN